MFPRTLEQHIPAEVHDLELALFRLIGSSDDLLNDTVVPTTSPTEHFSVPSGDLRKALEPLQICRKTIGLPSELKPRKEGADPLSSACNKALALYVGFLEVMVVHFNFLPKRKYSILTLLKWTVLALEDRLEEYYKTQSCYLLSLVTRQQHIIAEMPVVPSWVTDRPGYIQGGMFWRICRHAMRKQTLESWELAGFYAVTNVKRAGLAISEEKQIQSLYKHVKNMRGAEYKPQEAYKLEKRIDIPLRKPTLIEREYVPVEEVLEDVLSRLEDLLVKDFKGRTCDSEWRSPSVNACKEFRAKECGSHGHWNRDMFWRSVVPEFIGFARYKTRVVPVYVPYLPEDLYVDAKSRIDFSITPNATVHKVLEPFKCRVITAGPGVLYQLGRCIQKPLHTIMRQNTLFHLTGAPASRSFIEKQYNGVFISSEEGRDCTVEKTCRSFFVAGDYSAATDGMHPAISEHFCKFLGVLGYFSAFESKIASSCMRGHRLFYPDLVDKNGRLRVPDDLVGYFNESNEVEQTWGQLMGSPISFPILCYANAAVNWVAADYYYGRRLSYEDWVDQFRPIFNGDDTSFLSNSVHYDIWKRVASCAGLNSSLGKSYCSKQFVMINSEMFEPVYNCYGQVISFNDVFVLNPGLIKGQAKVMVDSREDKFIVSDHKMKLDRKYKETPFTELLPLVDQLNVATRKCRGSQKRMCDNIFMYHVKDRMKGTNRPWSVPRWLGGLGMKGVGHLTHSQRLATALILCAQKGQFKELDLQDALNREPKILTSLVRESPNFLLSSSRYVSSLEEKLGVEYEDWVSVDYVSPEVDNVQTLSLDKYFLGDCVEKVGEDRYSKLMKFALKCQGWLKPITDDKLDELFDQEYVPRQPDSPIFMV
jgi:hypothetical protein